jgi:demethylmenaquinone methyltransferase/2-methoxy-6-polyprenyl-1,4-benzoquinol methylase
MVEVVVTPLPVHGEGEKYALDDTADIYDDGYLKALFDEMQSTYERVSTLTSFGFNRRWRRQVVERLGLRQGMRIGDLMAGSGESWMYLLPRIGRDGALVAVDFSSEMMRQANERKQALQAHNVVTANEDVLQSSIATQSLDAVVCVYGVKTLSPQYQRRYGGFSSRAGCSGWWRCPCQKRHGCACRIYFI